MPQRFDFRFRSPHSYASLPFGVRPGSAWVEVDDPEDVDGDAERQVRIKFGFWRLETPLSNVVHAKTTGPYTWFKVMGPPRLSLKDSGVTYATCGDGGVCICFSEKVHPAKPFHLLSHEAATVTVDDQEGLVALLDLG